MSYKPVLTNQLINNNGELTIDVFNKNTKNDHNSNISINCNGKKHDSIKLNCPNGGIVCSSINTNISSNNILVKSRNSININSLNSIEIGKNSSNVLFNFYNDSLDINFNETEKSSVKINTNDLIMKSYNGDSSIVMNKKILLKSKGKISIGNIYNNTIDVNCKEDHVYINGNLSVSGKLVVDGGVIKSNSIENVVSNNQITFDLDSNVSKDWSIISKNLDKINGIFYNDKDNKITFKDNFGNLGIECQSIKVTNSNQEILLNINDCLTVDKETINFDGDLNINGSIVINNKIKLSKYGIIEIENLQLNQLFKFSVGNNYRFSKIQDCIDYIEENKLYENENIFIEIYPNKTYKENIFIRNKNINLIGINSCINIIGSITVFSDEVLENLHIKNINITSNLAKSNKFSNIDFLNLDNVHFILNNDSELLLENVGKIHISNSSIVGKNSSFLKTKNINKILIKTSLIDINCEIESSQFLMVESEIDLNLNVLKIITSKVVKFIRNDFKLKEDLSSLKNKLIYRNRTCILLDCIIEKKDTDGIFYPKLILNYNYNV